MESSALNLRTSFLKVWPFVAGGLFLVTLFEQHCSCGEPTSSSRDPASWALEAAERVSKLAEMAELLSEAQPPDSFEELRDHPEKFQKFLSLDNGPFGKVRPDRALWGLWLTTGMPPAQRQTDEPMHEYVKRNAEAYRTFVEKNKELSEESIHRMGMESAINAFGSPLWYMTLQYLKKRGGLRYYDRVIGVWSTPTTALAIVPLAHQSSYQRMSDALSNWVTINRREMVWDCQSSQFRPQGGSYRGTEQLMQVVSSEFSRSF